MFTPLKEIYVQIRLYFIYLFFLFSFIFKLYITVLVLPNIKMNPPQVYMCFIKQRHYFANESPLSQGYGFSSGHILMWDLDCEENWVPKKKKKNWCFWTMVLEKTLEIPLDCKQIPPVHPSGDQSWVFFGRTDAKAETPVHWPPHKKCWLIKIPDDGRDLDQREKGMTEDEMDGWHHRLNEHMFLWTPVVGDGQGSLAKCDSWGHKELDTALWLKWNEQVNCFLLLLLLSMSLTMYEKNKCNIF